MPYSYILHSDVADHFLGPVLCHMLVKASSGTPLFASCAPVRSGGTEAQESWLVAAESNEVQPRSDAPAGKGAKKAHLCTFG